jgi:hypothetical protein
VRFCSIPSPRAEAQRLLAPRFSAFNYPQFRLHFQAFTKWPVEMPISQFGDLELSLPSNSEKGSKPGQNRIYAKMWVIESASAWGGVA